MIAIITLDGPPKLPYTAGKWSCTASSTTTSSSTKEARPRPTNEGAEEATSILHYLIT